MPKIIVEITPDSKSVREYKVFDSEEVCVGRGFDCDVILQDVYVAARHLLITRTGDSIKVKDLGSENGTFLPPAERVNPEATLLSGDEVTLGKTRLRIYLDSHPVPAARILYERHKFLKLAGKPLVAWGWVGVMMGFTLLEVYCHTTKNEDFIKLLSTPIVVFCTILLWGGFWAFIGRLLRHKVYFYEHLSVCCAWLFSSAVLENIIDYMSFYANSKLLNTICAYILNSGLFIITLFASLTFSTNMSRAKKITFASIFTFVLVASFAGLKLSASKYYTWAPPYDTILKPPVLGSRNGRPIEEFIENTDPLFIFKEEEKTVK